MEAGDGRRHLASWPVTTRRKYPPSTTTDRVRIASAHGPCQGATRLLRFASALRVTRAFRCGSEGSYGRPGSRPAGQYGTGGHFTLGRRRDHGDRSRRGSPDCPTTLDRRRFLQKLAGVRSYGGDQVRGLGPGPDQSQNAGVATSAGSAGRSGSAPSAPVQPPLSFKRVPTRFVQKYTLRARLESSGSHEAVEGRPGHARELGDGGLGHAQLEEAQDVVLLPGEP